MINLKFEDIKHLNVNDIITINNEKLKLLFIKDDVIYTFQKESYRYDNEKITVFNFIYFIKLEDELIEIDSINTSYYKYSHKGNGYYNEINYKMLLDHYNTNNRCHIDKIVVDNIHIKQLSIKMNEHSFLVLRLKAKIDSKGIYDWDTSKSLFFIRYNCLDDSFVCDHLYIYNYYLNSQLPKMILDDVSGYFIKEVCKLYEHRLFDYLNDTSYFNSLINEFGEYNKDFFIEMYKPFYSTKDYEVYLEDMHTKKLHIHDINKHNEHPIIIFSKGHHIFKYKLNDSYINPFTGDIIDSASYYKVYEEKDYLIVGSISYFSLKYAKYYKKIDDVYIELQDILDKHEIEKVKERYLVINELTK